MSQSYELEIVEEYELLGEKRYRLRIKGTSIYLNVAADNPEKAVEKAIKMINDMRLDALVEVIKKEGQSAE